MAVFTITNAKIREFALQLLQILAGSLLYGMALSWFLIPYKIAPGGIGGVSQIFYHLFGVNVGLSMIIMNIPLLILGIMIIGRQFGLGTFIGFSLSSLMTDLVSLRFLYQFPVFKELIERYNMVDGVLSSPENWALTDNIFLASIAGSILLGVGIGLIFKARASTGGTDIPVAVLKKWFNLSIGTGYLIVDTGIILIIGVVFRDVNLLIWGVFGLFLSARFADIVTEGLSQVKAAYIICSSPEKEDEMVQHIYKDLDRGATFIFGEGTFSGEKKRIIYVTFHLRQTAILQRLTKMVDPEAFLVTYDVHDVRGFGFKSRSFTMD
jgi:uncharacterized membrane-anchored protein YitT (DUF2179 family)